MDLFHGRLYSGIFLAVCSRIHTTDSAKSDVGMHKETLKNGYFCTQAGNRSTVVSTHEKPTIRVKFDTDFCEVLLHSRFLRPRQVTKREVDFTWTRSAESSWFSFLTTVTTVKQPTEICFCNVICYLLITDF